MLGCWGAELEKSTRKSHREKEIVGILKQSKIYYTMCYFCQFMICATHGLEVDFLGMIILYSGCFCCLGGSTPTLARLVALPATLTPEH